MSLAAGEPIDGRILGICAIVAIIGGGAKAILRRRSSTKVIDIIAAAFANCLSGVCGGALVLRLWPSEPYIAIVVASATGFAGTALLDLIGEIALARIQRKTLEDFSICPDDSKSGERHAEGKVKGK